MAGEMPISTADHLDPTLGKDLRAAALLVIEGALIGPPPEDWAETLRNQCWSGRVIVIVDTAPEDHRPDDTIALVGRRDAGAAILALVQLWQSQRDEPLTPRE